MGADHYAEYERQLRELVTLAPSLQDGLRQAGAARQEACAGADAECQDGIERLDRLEGRLQRAQQDVVSRVTKHGVRLVAPGAPAEPAPTAQLPALIAQHQAAVTAVDRALSSLRQPTDDSAPQAATLALKRREEALAAARAAKEAAPPQAASPTTPPRRLVVAGLVLLLLVIIVIVLVNIL